MAEHSEPLTGWLAPTTGQMKLCTGHYLLTCLVFLFGLSPSIPAQPGNHETRSQQQQESGRTLDVNAAITAEITGDQSHSYHLPLTAGEFIHVIVSQQEVRLVIILSAPDGVKLREVSSPDDLEWPEHIWLIVGTTGTYLLEVRRSEAGANSGRYEVKLAESCSPTTRDKDRAAAGLLLHDALHLRNEHSQEALLKAVDKYQATLPMWRSAGDQVGEAEALRGLGNTYFELHDRVKNIEVLNQLLALRRLMGDRKGEASTLNSFGILYSATDEPKKALDFYVQALALEKQIGDHDTQISTLTSICMAQDVLGDHKQALDFCNQGLGLARTTGNKRQEAATLNQLASVYQTTNEYDKALDHYNQALTLNRTLGNRRAEASITLSLGRLYESHDENKKALDSYEHAQVLWKALGNRRYEAITLARIGGVYQLLDDSQNALAAFNEALTLARSLGDKEAEAHDLNHIGLIYSAISEPKKALDFFNQALSVRRAMGDKLEAEPHAQAIFECQELGAVPERMGRPEVHELVE